MSVVASIATYEKRAPHLRATLESIIAQSVFDRIQVMVGSEKLAEEVRSCYGELGITACVVPEIGPAKKHLAARFCQADDVVVTYDDDRVYPEGHARGLLTGLEQSGNPTGLLGYLAAQPLVAVSRGVCDLLHGEYGWAYQASWIPTQSLVDHPEFGDHDDAHLGWLLGKAGFRCHVIDAISLRRGVTINEPAREVGSLGMRSDARERFWQAMQATWWSSLPVRVGRPVPKVTSFTR